MGDAIAEDGIRFDPTNPPVALVGSIQVSLSTASSSTHANSGYTALGFSAGYDRYGNRWRESVTSTPSGYGPNQTLTFNTGNNQMLNIGYDQAGNVINDGVHTYTYDAENNLTAVDGGATASYVYDALNERVQANAGGQSQVYGNDLQGRRSTVWTNGATAVSQVQYYAGQQGLAYWSNMDSNIHFEHKDLRRLNRSLLHQHQLRLRRGQ